MPKPNPAHDIAANGYRWVRRGLTLVPVYDAQLHAEQRERLAHLAPVDDTGRKLCKRPHCDRPVTDQHPTAAYCGDECRRAGRAETQRRYEQRMTSRGRNRTTRTADLKVPCLKCGAKVGDRCVTTSGEHCPTHAIRTGKKCAGGCGTAVGRADYCANCRVESRREQFRASAARQYAKRKAAQNDAAA